MNAKMSIAVRPPRGKRPDKLLAELEADPSSRTNGVDADTLKPVNGVIAVRIVAVIDGRTVTLHIAGDGSMSDMSAAVALAAAIDAGDAK